MSDAVLSKQVWQHSVTAWARGHPVASFLARRLLAAAVTLFVVSVLIFLATNVLPGNAASVILGKQATGIQLRQLEHLMGLNRPLVVRYASWVGGFIRGNLGDSAAGYAAGGRISIWSLIHFKLVNSLLLAGITFVLAVPVSLLLGTVAAVRAGKPTDHGITIVSLALISLPEFVLGSLLILAFFSWLHVLPPVALFAPGVSPLSSPSALVLPVLTLLGVTVGAAVRMLRAGMFETLRSEYVEMARLHGLQERKVLLRYALRNGLGPSVQVFAQILQYLLGGIIVVEYLFAYPGLGAELVNAVSIRDVLEIEAITMIFATAFILINIFADLLVVMLVPKLRTGAR
jgi:peptide/nickel transport system permease protein